MKLNTRNFPWVVAGLLFALGSLWIHYEVKLARSGDAHADQLGALRVGSESPDLSATDLQGRPVVLSELRDRKVAVLDFWATWCGPCQMAMPELQEIHDDFKGRVEVIAVNVGEDPERVRRFIERRNHTFRVVTDRDEAIGNRFGVSSIPVRLVVGVDGLIESIRVGYSPNEADELRQLLDRLTQVGESVESPAL